MCFIVTGGSYKVFRREAVEHGEDIYNRLEISVHQQSGTHVPDGNISFVFNYWEVSCVNDILYQQVKSFYTFPITSMLISFTH